MLNAPQKTRVLKNTQLRFESGKVLDTAEYVETLTQLDLARAEKKKVRGKPPAAPPGVLKKKTRGKKQSAHVLPPADPSRAVKMSTFTTAVSLPAAQKEPRRSSRPQKKKEFLAE